MNPLETRYPCPVCLGAKLEKVVVADGLTLDHCPRCGGVWFEAGEVQRLRRTDAAALWREIVQRDGVHAMQCHSCRTHMPRTDTSCSLRLEGGAGLPGMRPRHARRGAGWHAAGLLHTLPRRVVRS